MRSLSARLLVLTVFFVMLSEVFIFVPSVARFRMTYCDNHLAAAHLASLALAASPHRKLDQPMTNLILRDVGAHAVILHRPNGMVFMLDGPVVPQPDVTFDLTKGNVPIWIQRSLETLARSDNRIMRVVGPAPTEPGATVELLLDEAPLRREMWDFGVRILELSVVISLTTAALVVSDGLADSAAPEVRRVAPRLFEAIDRAVALCTRTLDFSREGAPPFSPSRFELLPLIEEIEPAMAGDNGVAIEADVPQGLMVRADRDQLFRVLLNLTQNALEAGARHVRFSTSAENGTVAIDVADDGHGLPPRARENLFRPFFGSARPGGTGLGLAIARELMRGQGGDLALVDTTGAGTTFRLNLPAAESQPAASRRATA